jgi:hypothetical protein
LIEKLDKYLSGWSVIVLSLGGRLVRLNTVLDALPTFPMGAIELPMALLQAIEGLHHAFLRNSGDRSSGEKCLVAWAAVCRPKRVGGLGIKQLLLKNICLQMKLVHRIHANADALWPRWVWDCKKGRAAQGHHMLDLGIRGTLVPSSMLPGSLSLKKATPRCSRALPGMAAPST